MRTAIAFTIMAGSATMMFLSLGLPRRVFATVGADFEWADHLVVASVASGFLWPVLAASAALWLYHTGGRTST